MSNPPAGWYENPAGEGQRYWDGTTWTARFQQGVEERPSRPNTQAVGLAVLFGVLSFIGLLALLNPRIGGSTAYGAGRLFFPAALAAGVVGLVARGMSRRVGWWVYALAVPTLAAVIALGLTARDLKESTDKAESRGEPVGELSVPGAGAGWTVFDTPETRDEVRRVTDGMTGQLDSDSESVVAEFYTHDSAPASPILFLGVNGEVEKDASAEEILDSVLAGGYVDEIKDFDSGDVGGALGCGEAAAQGLEWVTCAWVGDKRVVVLRWQDRSVALEQAAELTRDLRERSLS